MIEFIMYIVLSALGLFIAVRVNAGRTRKYFNIMLVTFILLELYSISVLIGNNDTEGFISRHSKDYSLDVCFVIFLVFVLIYKYFHTRYKAAERVMCIVVRALGGVICVGSFVVLVYSINSISSAISKVEHSDESIYTIRSLADKDMVITADIQSDVPGSHLHYSKYDGHNNQKVYLDMVEDSGIYKIRLYDVNQSFDLSNGNMDEGAGVDTWESYDTTTQLWHIDETDGGWTITSYHSGLTICNRGSLSDDSVRVYSNLNDGSEKFILEKTISDEAATVMAANYSHFKLLGVSVYYLYILLYVAVMAATIFYLVKRRDE